jgi:hypothetical protein
MTLDLSRPANAPEQWHAVVIVGQPANGPWQTIVTAHPFDELLFARQSSPESIVAAVRWCGTRALALDLADHVERHIGPVSCAQKMPFPLVSMPQDQIVAILTGSAASLEVPVIVPEAA